MPYGATTSSGSGLLPVCHLSSYKCNTVLYNETWLYGLVIEYDVYIFIYIVSDMWWTDVLIWLHWYLFRQKNKHVQHNFFLRFLSHLCAFFSYKFNTMDLFMTTTTVNIKFVCIYCKINDKAWQMNFKHLFIQQIYSCSVLVQIISRWNFKLYTLVSSLQI